MKQLNLFDNQKKKYYGGILIKGTRKTARPLCSKRSIHVVLKAQKEINLRKNKAYIEGKIENLAQRFGIRIYKLSIQKDHIHLSLRIQDREQYKKFIRSLTGVLARRFGKGLWKLLPFTRIVEWGRGFKQVKSYIDQNEKEALGLIPYQPRRHNYLRQEP